MNIRLLPGNVPSRIVHMGVAAVWAICASAAAPAVADNERGLRTIVIRHVSYEQQISDYWQAGEYAAALDVIDRALRERPGDAVLLYNRACVKAQLDRLDAAAEALMDAVRSGFDAFHHMQRDPDLVPLRDHAVYRAILDARAFADEMLLDRRLESLRDRIDMERYHEVRDSSHRLHYIAPHEPESLAEIRKAVDAHLEVLNDMLFDDPPAQWTTVFLPHARESGERLGVQHAYGRYRHHHRELVALDLERGLRHELVHLLHHRHMDALGQQHPMWIQEGLAVIFEDYARDEFGNITFTPGERLNQAKRLIRDDRLLGWETITQLSGRAFNRESHRTYAQADAMLRYIDAKIGLAAFYEIYTQTHADDPTGRASLERAFDQPLEQIESDWRAWLDAQSFIVKP